MQPRPAPRPPAVEVTSNLRSALRLGQMGEGGCTSYYFRTPRGGASAPVPLDQVDQVPRGPRRGGKSVPATPLCSRNGQLLSASVDPYLLRTGRLSLQHSSLVTKVQARIVDIALHATPRDGEEHLTHFNTYEDRG